jgi:hypothetical protein
MAAIVERAFHRTAVAVEDEGGAGVGVVPLKRIVPTSTPCSQTASRLFVA